MESELIACKASYVSAKQLALLGEEFGGFVEHSSSMRLYTDNSPLIESLRGSLKWSRRHITIKGECIRQMIKDSQISLQCIETALQECGRIA
eukprot:3804233-Amphidinium_carterae.1